MLRPQVRLEPLPTICPVPDRMEEPRLELADRMRIRQQVAAQLLRLDDCLIGIRNPLVNAHLPPPCLASAAPVVVQHRRLLPEQPEIRVKLTPVMPVLVVRKSKVSPGRVGAER